MPIAQLSIRVAIMRRDSAFLLTGLTLVACTDAPRPTEPVVPVPSFAIADAPRGFTPGFYWLPPMVEAPTLGTGTFDATLSPAVQICELAGATCGPVLATFTMTTGPGSETVRVDGDHYLVNWHTLRFGLSPAQRYRISVSAGPGILLGYADLQAISHASGRADIDPNDAIPVVIGQTLPIKFRIETGIVGRVTVTPPSASITVGATQQFTASVTDLHGNPLGIAVTWASSNQGVAAVSVNGLATGVSTGTATITATAAGISGSSTLSVSGQFVSVSVSDDHTCGVTPAGAAYCWGSNVYGQLGDGSTTNSAVPMPVSGGFTFSAVSAGANFTCGLTTSGKAYCWGNGASGQLGNGPAGINTTPAPVAGGLTFSGVDAGSLHACGVTAAGAAYCWGANTAGELGTGSSTPSSIPLPVVGGLAFSTVSAGLFHTCGVTIDGSGYCWGFGVTGQLGNGATTNSSIPVLVSGNLTLSAISAGYLHSCAITSGGAAYCWGVNGVGQLGDGSTATSSTPIAVSGGTTFVVVTAGRDYTCGVAVSGLGFCWGSNFAGQLGDGTLSARFVPQLVSGSIRFVSMSASAFPSLPHTCGVANSGVAYCWGSNQYGQLGNGSTVDSPVPVAVMPP